MPGWGGAGGRVQVQATGREISTGVGLGDRGPGFGKVAHGLRVTEGPVALGLGPVGGAPRGLGNGVDVAVAALLLAGLKCPRLALGALHERVAVLLRSAAGLEVLGAWAVRRLWVKIEIKLCLRLGFFWAEKVWHIVVSKIFAGGARLAASLVGLRVHGAQCGSSKVAIEEALVGREAFFCPRQPHAEVLDVLAVRSVVRLQSRPFAGLVSSRQRAALHVVRLSLC